MYSQHFNIQLKHEMRHLQFIHTYVLVSQRQKIRFSVRDRQTIRQQQDSIQYSLCARFVCLMLDVCLRSNTLRIRTKQTFSMHCIVQWVTEGFAILICSFEAFLNTICDLNSLILILGNVKYHIRAQFGYLLKSVGQIQIS